MSERLFGEPRTATYVHEVAVSAALYDTLLVDELTENSRHDSVCRRFGPGIRSSATIWYRICSPPRCRGS